VDAVGGSGFNAYGGGLYPSTGCSVANTIVAMNTADYGPDIDSAIMSQGFNLMGRVMAAPVGSPPDLART